jgi:hypothetical protein
MLSVLQMVAVQLGSNIGTHVQNMILSYLETVPGVTAERSTVQKWNPKEFHRRSSEGNLLVPSLGNTSWSGELIEGNIMNSLPPASFHLVQATATQITSIHSGI